MELLTGLRDGEAEIVAWFVYVATQRTAELGK